VFYPVANTLEQQQQDHREFRASARQIRRWTAEIRSSKFSKGIPVTGHRQASARLLTDWDSAPVFILQDFPWESSCCVWVCCVFPRESLNPVAVAQAAGSAVRLSNAAERAVGRPAEEIGDH
jgi:hypothetical protein